MKPRKRTTARPFKSRSVRFQGSPSEFGKMSPAGQRAGPGCRLRAQVYFRCRSYRRARAILGAGVVLALSGCWVAPSANVHPPGAPRVIAGGIEVEGVADFAKVESVD